MLFNNLTKTQAGGTPVKIITLGGTESVTKNMTVYECGEDIIIVDCGFGFPDSEVLGVNVVIPDMTYLVENQHKIRGLVITHGHEDHIGAIPYLLKQIKVPIYANKLVQGFIREKMKDKDTKGLLDGVSFTLFSPETEELRLGCFKLSAFRVNHSVPSSHGIAIRTPQGLILHMADYKIDWTPVLDKPIDIAKISLLGQEGVLCLLTDCLGATTEGYSKSESSLNHTFTDLLDDAEGRQVFMTTISSNISRMYQIMSAALLKGRKIVLGGRSIEQSVSVAKSLGYLPFVEDLFVKEDDAHKYEQKNLLYIVAGCYGQRGSALDRIARGEHDSFELEKNAMVVFSADPNPPGVAEAVERVMDALTLSGAEVVYGKIQDNLHVSGHGPKGDLMTIAAIVKPKYFIPIGGTATKARAYTNMVGSLGVDKSRVFELLEGASVVFENGAAHLGDKIETNPVFINANGGGEVEPIVLRDRDALSNDGVFVVVIPIVKKDSTFGKAEVVTRGFVYVKESKALIGRSVDIVNKFLDKSKGQAGDFTTLRGKIENEVSRFLYRETKRKPMVIVHSIAV